MLLRHFTQVTSPPTLDLICELGQPRRATTELQNAAGGADDVEGWSKFVGACEAMMRKVGGKRSVHSNLVHTTTSSLQVKVDDLGSGIPPYRLRETYGPNRYHHHRCHRGFHDHCCHHGHHHRCHRRCHDGYPQHHHSCFHYRRHQGYHHRKSAMQSVTRYESKLARASK